MADHCPGFIQWQVRLAYWVQTLRNDAVMQVFSTASIKYYHCITAILEEQHTEYTTLMSILEEHLIIYLF
jgi:hypothetical protein